MMIGKQIQQPVQSWNEYTKTVLWCNDNKAMIEDKCDWYEVVALPEETLDEFEGYINAVSEMYGGSAK